MVRGGIGRPVWSPVWAIFFGGMFVALQKVQKGLLGDDVLILFLGSRFLFV